MTAIRPCPHREVLLGSLATPADLEVWTATFAAETCPRCVAPAPRPELPPLPLPAEVASVLAQEGRAGARRAQAALDVLEVGAELLPAIRQRLAQQPGTSTSWQRWWASWRGGALFAAS